jgi:2-dehydro-3-deoxy-D-arabinonate dehydratase
MRIELTVTDIAHVAGVEGVARRLPSHASIDALLTADDPLATAFEWFEAGHPSPDVDEASVRAPIGNQEVWAAGVTYLRSRVARVAESRQSGGDTFYDLVYDADRSKGRTRSIFRRPRCIRRRHPSAPASC